MPVQPITTLSDFTQIVSQLFAFQSLNAILIPLLLSQINGDKAVVIDFWAPWCPPCRMISPIFEQLSGTATDVSFYKVDVDEVPEISQELNIQAVCPPSVSCTRVY